MEITKGQVVKVTTTKDKCIRITVDIEQAFVPANVNILQWQDTMITTEECLELAGRLGIASTYGSPTCLDFTDASFVLQEAMKNHVQYELFTSWVTNNKIPHELFTTWVTNNKIPLGDVISVFWGELMIDQTGKLAKLLLEYLRSKEHDSDHAAKSGDKRT